VSGRLDLNRVSIRPIFTLISAALLRASVRRHRSNWERQRSRVDGDTHTDLHWADQLLPGCFGRSDRRAQASRGSTLRWGRAQPDPLATQGCTYPRHLPPGRPGRVTISAVRVAGGGSRSGFSRLGTVSKRSVNRDTTAPPRRDDRRISPPCMSGWLSRQWPPPMAAETTESGRSACHLDILK
jgi:hypothetical protein